MMEEKGEGFNLELSNLDCPTCLQMSASLKICDRKMYQCGRKDSVPQSQSLWLCHGVGSSKLWCIAVLSLLQKQQIEL